MKRKPPRLLLDEHIWRGLVQIFFQEGYDVVHIVDLGGRGMSDIDVMALAAQENRVILTFNSRDYVPLAIDWFEQGKDHPGVLLSPELSRGELQRRVRLFLEQTAADDMRNQIRWLSDFKTR
ncbi:MAG: DUF5615 family PIN-like protein [Anaerolineae bacterium]|nr:DUF5615 family PIN-like protein [Anaerolineae bacterium]